MMDFISDDRCFNAGLLNLIRTRQNVQAQYILHNINKILISDNTGSTLLHLAAAFGNEVMTQYLINRGCGINCRDKKGRTSLMRAVLEGNVLAAQVLLKANADIYIVDYNRKTVLDLVVDSASKNMDMAKIFFQEISIDEFASKIPRAILAKKLIDAGLTMHHIVFFETVDLARLLLDHGCLVNDVENERHKTPLHLSVELENVEMVRLFIKYGANTHAMDLNGNTPIFCLYDDRTKINQLEDTKTEVFRLLFEKMEKSTLIRTNSKREMQISGALRYGSTEVLKIILQSDIDMQSKDGYENSILHHLACNENFNCFQELEKKIFDVNARNIHGLTALHYAAARGHVNVAKFLLNNKADIDARGLDRTPLFYIFYECYRDTKPNKCVELLLHHGTDVQQDVYCSGAWFTILDSPCSSSAFHLLKPIVEYLSFCQMQGMKIRKVIEDKINSSSRFKKDYDECQQCLVKMMTTTISGKVTLYNFLIAKDTQIRFYARNQEIVSHVRKTIERREYNSTYLNFLLEERLDNAITWNALKKRAVKDLSKITGLCYHAYPSIVEFIVDYFEYKDFERLHRACGELI